MAFRRYPIRTPLDGALRYEIYLPANNTGEFLFHLDMIQQAPVCVRCEPYEQVQVAFRAEILAQCRSKDPEFGDLPAAAGTQ